MSRVIAGIPFLSPQAALIAALIANRHANAWFTSEIVSRAGRAAALRFLPPLVVLGAPDVVAAVSCT